MHKKKRKLLKLGGLLSGLLLTSGCTATIWGTAPEGSIDPQTQYLSFERPAPIPPGVVRYCWEEPMVQFQPNGPGLDQDRFYYEPSYVAVRMVRQGRWRPCQAVPSELTGETKNER